MTANIIHNLYGDRAELLKKELHRQKWVPDVKYFDPIYAFYPERGISLAHKQIVADAKANNYPFVWIMEDDVRFPSIYGMEYFIENSPIKNFELAPNFDLYLGGIYSGTVDAATHTVKKFSGLHCYIVHERFYDAFLSADEGIHLDYALSQIGGVFKVCQPFAAIQHNGFSENTGKVENYDKFLRRYKIYGL